MKQFLPLFLWALVPFVARAQTTPHRDDSGFAQSARIRFGVKAGLNVSNADFNRGFPEPAAPVATAWRPGVVAGLLLQVPVGGRFSLQPEYLYSQMGGKKTGPDADYTFGYLSLPVLLKYGALPRLALLAGPQFDLLIHASQRVNGVSETITHDTEERSIGATAGLEFYVLRNLSLTARYTYGLNHIGLGQRSAVTEFAFESVQFSTDIKF